MSRPRSSTAELAVLIDGFYDDFESHPAEVDSPSPTADVNESAADMHATDEALPPTLDSARQMNHDLTETHENLCRRAKIVLQQRAQGRQRPVFDASKLNEAEARFRACLKLHPQIQQEKADNANRYRERICDLQKACDVKEEQVSKIRKTFTQFCVDIAHKHFEDDRPAMKTVQTLLEKEKTVAQEMEEKRLESIAMESQRRLLEKRMNDRDCLGDGLHLMDFEQLKIENQTLHEKIDERHHELMQLKKKTGTAVQVLTHVCEKRHFVAAEIDAKKSLLNDDDEIMSEQKSRLQQRKLCCTLMQRQKTYLDRHCSKVVDKALLDDIQRLKTIKVALLKQLAHLRDQFTSVHV